MSSSHAQAKTRRHNKIKTGHGQAGAYIQRSRLHHGDKSGPSLLCNGNADQGKHYNGALCRLVRTQRPLKAGSGTELECRRMEGLEVTVGRFHFLFSVLHSASSSVETETFTHSTGGSSNTLQEFEAALAASKTDRLAHGRFKVACRASIEVWRGHHLPMFGIQRLAHATNNPPPQEQ